MSSVVKNLAIILGLATVAFAGYYMYTQQGATILRSSTGEAELQDMLAKTQVFIQHRQELDSIVLDVDLFENKKFTSLRSYTKPVIEQEPGRPNPFAPANIPVAPRQLGTSSN